MGRLAKRLPMLRRHGEVIATEALACLLDHDVLRAAFESLQEIPTDVYVRWVTQRVLTGGLPAL